MIVYCNGGAPYEEIAFISSPVGPGRKCLGESVWARAKSIRFASQLFGASVWWLLNVAATTKPLHYAWPIKHTLSNQKEIASWSRSLGGSAGVFLVGSFGYNAILFYYLLTIRVRSDHQERRYKFSRHFFFDKNKLQVWVKLWRISNGGGDHLEAANGSGNYHHQLERHPGRICICIFCLIGQQAPRRPRCRWKQHLHLGNVCCTIWQLTSALLSSFVYTFALAHSKYIILVIFIESNNGDDEEQDRVFAVAFPVWHHCARRSSICRLPVPVHWVHWLRNNN